MEADCFAENVGSWRVMEKSGMMREGCIRNKHIKEGKYHDECLYGILRSEWEEKGNDAFPFSLVG